MNFDTVVNWGQKVLAFSVPSAGIVFLLFRWAGNTWAGRFLNRDLEQFKRQQQQVLEAFKGKQQIELERLRHLLSSRVSRIHEKEFKVLPKAWLMLNELHGAVYSALGLGRSPVPDFFSFTTAKLEAFLKGETWLTDYQKDQIRDSEDANGRQAFYMDATRSRDLDLAGRKHQIFNNYFIENRIFMTEELREKFTAAERILFSALTRYSVSETRHGELARDAQKEMLAPDLELLVREIEKAVQLRLHYEDAT